VSGLTTQAPALGGGQKCEVLGSADDRIYVLIRIWCRSRHTYHHAVGGFEPLWILVTLRLSPIQMLTASGGLSEFSMRLSHV
jgi:hypothetical protein